MFAYKQHKKEIIYQLNASSPAFARAKTGAAQKTDDEGLRTVPHHLATQEASKTEMSALRLCCSCSATHDPCSPCSKHEQGNLWEN